MEGYSRPPERHDTDVVGARVVATIIDSVIVMALLFGTFFALMAGLAAGASASQGTLPDSFATVFLIPFLVVFGYYLLLEGLWDGYTVGKKVMGIKVVKDDGSSIGILESVVRNVLRIIDSILYYAVGFLVMAVTDRRQRLGDLIASTVVVRETPTERPQGARAGAQQRTQGQRKQSGQATHGQRTQSRQHGDQTQHTQPGREQGQRGQRR